MKLPSQIHEQLVENNLDSIVMTDPLCQILYANKVALALHGYSFEELLGKNISIFDVPGNEIPESYRIELRESGKWSGEALRRRKDGSTFHASMSVFSIHDENGKIIGYAGNTKDITRSISTKEALIEKSIQLKSIVDNTEDVIVSIDKDLELVEFNEVMANFVKLGYQKELKKGDALLDYIEKGKHDHLKNIYARVFKGERVIDGETFTASNGGSIYFESSYNPIFNEDKTVKGISIFSKNVTDRVSGELALKKAFEEKELLLSEIHHRLKNNLAIISSILQLQEININNDEAIKALKESRMRIKSTALLHEMLYQNDSIDAICVKKYLTKLFADINKTMGSNIHTLKIDGDDASLRSHNAVPAGLLFNELFTNSIKHAFKNEKPGEINILISTEKDKTVFEITESESSFPSDIDFDNSSSTGLTLIKTFTEQLNGEIRLTKSPRTKFHLTLNLS